MTQGATERREEGGERRVGSDEQAVIDPALLKRINETPLLLSVLYDANLLPEQVVGDKVRIQIIGLVVGATLYGYETGKEEARAEGAGRERGASS